MAVNGGGGPLQDEEQVWRKALLSRDFDLCHTKLLLLDGAVTLDDRNKLIDELFLTVKNIENVVTQKDVKKTSPAGGTSSERTRDKNCCSTRASSSLASPNQLPASSSSSLFLPQPMNKNFIPPYNLELINSNLNNRSDICPICLIRQRKESRHYCSPCRIFMNKMQTLASQGLALPRCTHRGRQTAFECKGCRRYRHQLYWPLHRNGPFPLPLLME